MAEEALGAFFAADLSINQMPASDFRKSSHHGGKEAFQKLDESGAPVDSENNVSEWTSEDVSNWLDKLGLGEHAKSFEHHRIVGDMVHSLTESHLKELGVTIIGQRMTFLRDASRIRRHSANKVRFETIWESDAEIYTRGPADWLYRQCIFEPCAPPAPQRQLAPGRTHQDQTGRLAPCFHPASAPCLRRSSRLTAPLRPRLQAASSPTTTSSPRAHSRSPSSRSRSDAAKTRYSRRCLVSNDAVSSP